MMMNLLESGIAERARPCRLCGGPTALGFTARVLDKYPTGYWRCSACGSMQTDPPHWLDEAYANVRLAADTGMVARNLQMAQLSSLLLHIAGIGKSTLCLDWGGGNGLFCRMMRDQGYNFFNADKYAQPYYCAGFTADSIGIAKCDIVTAFEIFEHLPNPNAELAEILRFDPKLWIFSTQLYEDQDEGWTYFNPARGRHVFFYSEKALHDFAEAHGYRFMRGRHLHMFVKRAGNPYLQRRSLRYRVRTLLGGGALAGAAAGLHFLVRQRQAYRYWQADSAQVRRGLDSQAARPERT